ncbi:MAG: hypothetical protein B7C24_15660 [Bacteroidetes bacterium 4572_77]|nr:MAG: hypothetical protein B7C24_15660 [Bacteroidetes bacterium 4572_77]
MQFEKGYIYHIYNQGNNREKLFYNRAHYLFFLRKVNTYILPYADVLAWCLMPNHFHLMVLVREVELVNGRLGVSQRHAESQQTIKPRTFNKSIGIMIMAYAKAYSSKPCESQIGK